MGNEQNLIPNSKRSPSEVRKNGKKGGIKSGETRRRKKTFKQLMSSYLELKPVDNEVMHRLEEEGIDPDDITNKALLVKRIFDTAVAGDVNAAKLVMSMIAEDIQHEELKLKQKEFKLKADSKKEDGNETLQKLDEVLDKMTGGEE